MTSAEKNIFIRINLGEFLAFLVIGLPLPVLPLYIHNELGYSPAVAGACVGAHFLSTILFRTKAGRMADTWGSRHTVLCGYFFTACSGLPYMLLAVTALPPPVQIGIILVSRVCLGISQGMLGTGSITWGIGLLGPLHAGKILAWSGLTMYAGIGFGAPAGLALWDMGGLFLLGLVCMALPGCSTLAAFVLAETPVQKAALKTGAGRILRQVLRPGISLFLNGVGNAVISAFIGLYFAAKDWENAGLALSCFGFSFVIGRMVSGSMVERSKNGGAAKIAFALEMAGLGLIAAAPHPGVAIAGVCLTGVGCSIVFPSLAVDLLRDLRAEIRGTALSFFTIFQDISYAISGPLAGLLVPFLGYSSVFYTGAACAALGLILIFLWSGRRHSIS
ncbi:MAG: MFS transporter [Desulfovibrio sp.]|jgi:predicted MFS family arabinose efflux permease|nr:MFS transporter [Desulfovibrio sp.]